MYAIIGTCILIMFIVLCFQLYQKYNERFAPQKPQPVKFNEKALVDLNANMSRCTSIGKDHGELTLHKGKCIQCPKGFELEANGKECAKYWDSKKKYRALEEPAPEGYKPFPPTKQYHKHVSDFKYIPVRKNGCPPEFPEKFQIGFESYCRPKSACSSLDDIVLRIDSTKATCLSPEDTKPANLLPTQEGKMCGCPDGYKLEGTNVCHKCPDGYDYKYMENDGKLYCYQKVIVDPIERVRKQPKSQPIKDKKCKGMSKFFIKDNICYECPKGLEFDDKSNSCIEIGCNGDAKINKEKKCISYRKGDEYRSINPTCPYITSK